ncbi:MAG: hypothetical protein KDB80_13830 [Planctomycetes bacterium]|nr:hypothetical protein [Planctomycetota bacterium]
MRPAILLAPLLLAATLVGQKGDEREVDPRDKPGFRPAAEEQPLSEQFLDRFLSTVVGSRPRRLAPGETGTIKVILALRGAAAIVAEHPFEVRYTPQQGPLLLGSEWTIDDPAPAAADSVLAGQAVYANTAIVSIPVRIADDAKHGQHWLNLAIECELTNSTTGKRLGIGKKSIRGSVQVGAPLPTPTNVEVEPPDSISREPAAEREVIPDLDRGTADRNRDTEADLRAAELDDVEPISGGDDPDGGWTTVTEEDSSSVTLMIVGGLFLLALIAVVARRR